MSMGGLVIDQKGLYWGAVIGLKIWRHIFNQSRAQARKTNRDWTNCGFMHLKLFTFLL